MITPAKETAATPRRELATRNARWAAALARLLGRAGVRPNAVSIAGVVFAVGTGAALVLTPTVQGAGRVVLLLAAAACIQLRLLCNLLDGMLAVEEGFKSKTGDLFNDLPDRLADVVILVGAGYAAREWPYGVPLGWAAAVLAVFTAYVRVLAGSLRQRQHFIGPMAKQHRMFALTVATLLACGEVIADLPPRVLLVGLVVIVAGSVVTAIRRIGRLARELEGR
jgi:phosphatidylglycerophosphate synthase